MLGKSREEAEGRTARQGPTGSRSAAPGASPHKVIPGNRPSNTLVVERISARRLGALIMYGTRSTYRASSGASTPSTNGAWSLARNSASVYSRLVGSEPGRGRLDPGPDRLLPRPPSRLIRLSPKARP